MTALLQSRRARLVAVLGVATLAISVLVVSAAGSSISYYATPEELNEHVQQQTDLEGDRWRVGGRVVDGTITELNGRPIAWEIEGDEGFRMDVSYDGIVPDLFGPRTFVVVEGAVERSADGTPHLLADSVIIKHESEFVTDPADASIAD
jgi:cytochrome c-type biogenesis protein CcmE